MVSSGEDEAVRDDTRPRCEYCSSDRVEEQAESGEWWLHCHKCGMDNAIEKENDMKEFKPGYVVMLKSGGAPMTVEKTTLNDVQCVWFTLDGNFNRSSFLKENVTEPDKDYLDLYKGKWK